MKIEVSTGEVVDKVTILEIKTEKFKNPDKLKNVKKEYDILKKEMEKTGITTGSEEFKKLKEINLRLWNIEDQIRIEEANKRFEERFIELARSVYHENDKRAALKKEINLKFDSTLIEEKEYVNYKARK